ncbi:hypothetical protein LTR64_007045 [Lithohypha guttulata]|uniref:uncharacterized protein n=1 Tax=Lithohypha guttulata TaxID=1690604 RepID=UPI00315C8E02
MQVAVPLLAANSGSSSRITVGARNLQRGSHELPGLYQPATERTEISTSPLAVDVASSDHATHVQKVFLAARATLHRDMFAASSPASSIESRMNLGRESPLQTRDGINLRDQNDHDDVSTRNWRYSTAPSDLAAASTDVREPLPSPTLPEVLHIAHIGQAIEHSVEPVSSGFNSPNVLGSMHGAERATTIALPSSDTKPDSDSENTQMDTTPAAETDEVVLGRQMTQLKVSTEDREQVAREARPTSGQSTRNSSDTSRRSRSESSPEREIYLSPTAEAAANSAKAKRRRLKEGRDGTGYLDTSERNDIDQFASSPPDTFTRRFSSMTPCPDPLAHQRDIAAVQRPLSAMSTSLLVLSDERHPALPGVATVGLPRATATGSPMPFIKSRFRPLSARCQPQHSPSIVQPHGTYQHINTLNEHFRPGWYYTRDILSPPEHPTYSFSTAASKVVGSSQAPDSRIRDSYKTDTLTALAKPQSRYRKNGLGAELAPRGVGRFYPRPTSSARPPSARTRASSRQTYTSDDDVQFRSSPPRSLKPEQHGLTRRKRAMDDLFVLAEDQSTTSRMAGPDLRMNESDEMMEIDEQTRAAVRISIFGTNTPEALRQARQGIQELSPNVQVFRKGTQEHSHLRKKRRPSYWDNDLKEIRESPAGRGGVNSPVSAQASMQAEFEIASPPNTEMDIDENGLIDDVTSITIELGNECSGVKERSANFPDNIDQYV